MSAAPRASCDSEAPATEAARAGAFAPVLLDPAMIRLYSMVESIARGRISVLLLGETGVGKEVLAEAVHERSPRTGKPFVSINCACLSEQLLEGMRSRRRC